MAKRIVQTVVVYAKDSKVPMVESFAGIVITKYGVNILKVKTLRIKRTGGSISPVLFYFQYFSEMPDR